MPEQPIGFKLSIDVAGLIELVRISPHAPSYLRSVVETTVKSAGFSFPVEQSDMYADPIW